MGNGRATTTLDIKVNARQVGDLMTKLKQAFNEQLPRTYNRAMREVNTRLRENVRETERIVSAMGKVKSGSEAYSVLQRKLKDANRSAQELERTLMRVGGGGHRRPSGGFGGGGGGGGGGGMSAGQALGGMQMGAMNGGAIGTALQAVPWLGMAAAGAYMAASGTFASYQQHEQALLGAAPYMMTSRRAVGFDPRTRTVGGGSGAAGMTDAQMMNDFIQRNRDGAAHKVVLGGESVISGLQRASGLTDSQGRTLLEKRAANSMRVTYGADALTGSGPRVVRDKPFDPAAFTAIGVKYGIKPQQAVQMAGQLSQGMARPITPAEMEQALSNQTLFGVGIQQTSSWMSAASRTSYNGSTHTGGDMTKMLAGAVEAGMNAAEIGEYLQEQTGFLKNMERAGQKVNVGELAAAQSGLRATGIDPWRIGGISNQMGMAGQRIGKQGMSTGADVRMMKALGYTGKGGAAEYAKYSLMIQDAGMAAEAMPRAMESMATDYGLDPYSDMAALMTQRMAQQMGVTLGAGESRKMAAGGRAYRAGVAGSAGRDDDPEAVQQRYNRAARNMVSTLAPAAVGKAEIEAQRIETGGKIAGAMLDLDRVTVQIAGTFQNSVGPALEYVTSGLDDFSSALDKATEGMWVSTGNTNVRGRPR